MPMQTSLAEHLKCLAAVNAPAEVTVVRLTEWLGKYGPTMVRRWGSARDGLAHLLPLRSFPKRYLVLGRATFDWTLILDDMRYQVSDSDAWGVGRALGASAIGVCCQETQRLFRLFFPKEVRREIESMDDGGRWAFRARGEILPFEQPSDLEVPPRRRLPPDLARQYFQAVTGSQWPDVAGGHWDTVATVERSHKDLRGEVLEYATAFDV